MIQHEKRSIFVFALQSFSKGTKKYLINEFIALIIYG